MSAEEKARELLESFVTPDSRTFVSDEDKLRLHSLFTQALLDAEARGRRDGIEQAARVAHNLVVEITTGRGSKIKTTSWRVGDAIAAEILDLLAPTEGEGEKRGEKDQKPPRRARDRREPGGERADEHRNAMER